MAQTPEEIAHLLTPRLNMTAPAAIAAAIRAYGDQRAAQALAEQKSAPDKTPQPTRLERLARDMATSQGLDWETIWHTSKDSWCDLARAAVGALKRPYDGRTSTYELNLALESILSESEGK